MNTADPSRTDPEIELYWRPGCVFCMALRGPLRRSGLPVREVNIWDDPAAAARVRWVADGNETVPTVFVGSRALVNPTVGQVLATVRDHAPDLAVGATPKPPRWQPLLAATGFGVLWLLLAARAPSTTYHLAPPLVSAAAPVTHRWLAGVPAGRGRALRLAAVGTAIALVATAVLGWRGLLAGPDLTGGDAAVAEAVMLAVLGAALGWWVAQRRGRGPAGEGSGRDRA